MGNKKENKYYKKREKLFYRRSNETPNTDKETVVEPANAATLQT